MLSDCQKSEILRLATKARKIKLPKFADGFFIPLQPPAPELELSRWLRKTLEKPLFDAEKLKTLTKSQREKVEAYQKELLQAFSEMLKVMRNENSQYDYFDN